MSKEPHLEVMMVLQDLNNIPEPEFPAGYSMVSYTPGDESIWLKIQNSVGRDREFDYDFFKRQFESASGELEKRMFFLNEGDLPIGTITAWVDDIFMDKVQGRIHWVAIINEKQGRGLSRPMLFFALHRLAEYGHFSAYLTTEITSVKAINLYKSAGFVESARNSDEQLFWDRYDWSDKYR